MALRLEFLPAARRDFADITDWLTDTADAATAKRYVDRVEARCWSLVDFATRGTPRADLGGQLRSVPFERSATIFYRTGPASVQIVRIMRAGRDVGRAFER